MFPNLFKILKRVTGWFRRRTGAGTPDQAGTAIRYIPRPRRPRRPARGQRAIQQASGLRRRAKGKACA